MHDQPIQRTGLIVACMLAVLFNIGDLIVDRDVKSFVVFCDVGQGDASYIHIKPNLDILIDAGKYTSVDSCIRKNNHSFDKTIDAVFISHLQVDHFGGVESLRTRYKIATVYVNTTRNMNAEAQRLLSNLRASHIPIQSATAGDVFEIGKLRIALLWPTLDYLNALQDNHDPNTTSQILHLQYKQWSILYTGDIPGDKLFSLSNKPNMKSNILKVPHHGSKNGLNRNLLLLADPTYSVISVGKNNPYGHPSREVLELLEKYKSHILRTDILGDITFLLD